MEKDKEIILKGDTNFDNIPSTNQKALRINLNKNIYGTFAEIGAGQETVRKFFRAGGASGTIAKTMSAYDKDFSDAIYGPEDDGRYVTEARLKKNIAKYRKQNTDPNASISDYVNTKNLINRQVDSLERNPFFKTRVSRMKK